MAQNPQQESNVLPNQTKIDRFVIDAHIGHGGYGEIYSVYDDKHEGPFAMKVEMKSSKKHGLTEEVHYLKMLRGSPMFPSYICSGETNELRYFVMELLGPSISLVRRSLPEQRYSKLTATILAKEMLKCIEELHRRGYVHRDIKPGNFLIRPDRKLPICLIDFGLSRRYADKETGNPLAPRNNPGFIGTCSFASVNAHEGKELGRVDDIFSWFYTVIEMVERRLPWPGSKDREKTYRMKQTIAPLTLTRSLPRQFNQIYLKTQQLKFTDKPDYQFFYRLLDRAIGDLGGEGKPFDWENLTPEALALISVISLDMGPLPNPDKKNNKETSSTIGAESSGSDSMHVVPVEPSKPPNEPLLLKEEEPRQNTTSLNDFSKHEESIPEHSTPHVLELAEVHTTPNGTDIQPPMSPIAHNQNSPNKSNGKQKSNSKYTSSSSYSESQNKKNNNNKNNDDEQKQRQIQQQKEQQQTKEQQQQQQAQSKKEEEKKKNQSDVNKEENLEEIPKAQKTDKKDKKKKKKKGKSDSEPGCKGCTIA